jgi:3-hydroxyacyl-CoA dehydrogenase
MRPDKNKSRQVGMKFESLVELMKLVEIERNED